MPTPVIKPHGSSMGRRVAFSYYGIGPNGRDNNVSGSCGGKLTNADGTPTPLGTHAFAELYNGTALGGLPCGSSIVVVIDGHGQGIIQKADIGTAATSNFGLPRAIDLWEDTLPTLGITDKSAGVWAGTVFTLEEWSSLSGEAVPFNAIPSPIDPSVGGLPNDEIIKNVIRNGLAAFMGLKDGETIEDAMKQAVIRVMEVLGGSALLSLGLVLFALQLRKPGDAGLISQILGYVEHPGSTIIGKLSGDRRYKNSSSDDMVEDAAVDAAVDAAEDGAVIA